MTLPALDIGDWNRLLPTPPIPSPVAPPPPSPVPRPPRPVPPENNCD